MHVKTVLHSTYGVKAHEYINEQLKESRGLLSLGYYKSSCEISWESKFVILPRD